MGKHHHTNSSPEQLANLRVFGRIPKEEQLEKARKGGIASQAKRRQAKTFKEAASWLMSCDAFATKNDAVNALKEKYPDINNAEAMVAAVMKRVLDEGDSKGFTTLRDTTGELPAQTVNLQNQEPMTINIKTVG